MSADVRRLLASHRASRRISSPYATYSLAGALFCNACSNAPIKSESLWEAHTRTPQHRQNVANKPPPKAAKRPPGGISTNDGDGEGAGGGARKKVKVAEGRSMNVNLPAGFFGDGGVNIDDSDEEEEVEDTAVPTVKDGKDDVVVEGRKEIALPSDFFAGKSAPVKDIDAEWEAFQADIAETEAAAEATTIAAPTTATTNAVISAAPMTAAQAAAATATKTGDVDAEEKEDAQERMAEFFEEQSSLEERVRALKEKRERLRMEMAAKEGDGGGGGGGMVLRRGSEMELDDDKEKGDGEEDEEDEEDEEEEDMFDLWASGGRWH